MDSHRCALPRVLTDSVDNRLPRSDPRSARESPLEGLDGELHAEIRAGSGPHLGRLVIAKAFNSREGKEKATKTGAKKLIPVHPFAASVLKAWRDAGWKEWMGRESSHEDFIVPQSDGKQVPNWKLLDEFYADLDVLKFTVTACHPDDRTHARSAKRFAAAARLPSTEEGQVEGLRHLDESRATRVEEVAHPASRGL
jgi:hypothetical protein